MSIKEQVESIFLKHAQSATAEVMALYQSAAAAATAAAFGFQGDSEAPKAPAAKRTRAKSTAEPAEATMGVKRSAEEVEALMTSIHTHLTANPSQGMEALGKALGKATRELSLPMKKLIESNRVQVQGTKRATRYTAKAA